MDSNTDEINPATDHTPTVSDVQVNPLTIMTSVPPFKPVDEDQENALESTNVDLSKPPSSEMTLTTSFNTDVSSPTKLLSLSNITDQQASGNMHLDNRSIAAWVESTTTENASPSLERSPSLPSTLLEPAETRSRRNSTVSTLCDQQTSLLAETLSSQQGSFSIDMQRSFSVPIHDQYHDDDVDDDRRIVLPVNEEEDEEDMSMKFLPVPDSSESDVDKQPKKLPFVNEEPVRFEKRSLTTSESPKKSPNVSFHASVSFETHQKPLIPNRRRRSSWNTNKNKSPTVQRSQSTMVSTPPPSLHAQILRKQFKTALSMPNGAYYSAGDTTRQSSSLSDHVFLSLSNTNSSSSRSYSNQSKDHRFLPVPSTSSIISSDRNPSVISDASGRSGIESTNLETSISEQLRESSLDNENPIERKPILLRRQRNNSASTSSSETPSTQSLLSSDDELNNLNTKAKDLYIDKDTRKGAIDKRRDVLKQLMWLLEKKTTIYARYGRRISNSSPKQSPQKSTSNSFVEFCSSFRSNNTLNANLRNETENPSKTPSRLYSTANENSTVLHSLPLTSQLSYIDPMSQSCTSVRSTHSDSSAATSLINTKPIARTSLHAPTSLTRKRSSHRRGLSSLTTTTRDRKNSFNKSDQLNISQSSQQEHEEKSPLVRNIHNILNEHLTMINTFMTNHSFNTSMSYHTQNPSIRDFIYGRLNELSQQNPMNQRCSRVETKAFIDLISSFQMNRAHHYSVLTNSVKDLLVSNNDTVHFSNRYTDNEDDLSKDGHIASNESSNTSSPSLTRYTSTESKYEVTNADEAFNDHPLRFFRILSEEYIRDCERTENELKKLFDSADQQHILYCLKHIDSGHTNDSLAAFHRRLDALFVWFNLYYELTISVKKLSGLLRCDHCDDWPKLRFRSIATKRERKAKRALENDDDDDDYSIDKESNDEREEKTKSMEENVVEIESEDSGDSDILPKTYWPEEPLDHLSRLDISSETTENETNPTPRQLNRISCYRNFVYYMDKRSYQVKYDGLARTLIERVAPVLVKTRLALLQTNDRHKIKIEQVLAGLPLCDFQSLNSNKTESNTDLNHEDTDDKLVDTDNPVADNSTADINIGELTIEKWLFHVLKSCSTIKTICSHTEDILKHNWLELHQQLGLPSLLPIYFFIINVLLDVLNECLRLYIKPYINNDTLEIDSLCRQQLVREAKLVLRDALATRLYSVRMMEQFVSHSQIIRELAEFDENTVKLYTHYKQFLSTVCVNRAFGVHDDDNMVMNNETNMDLYYYVDEETSELIKEYYFARDLTVTLGSRTEIRDLCIDFSTLTQRILAQLKEELNGKTEKYYQVFAVDMSNTSSIHDGSCSADVTSESARLPLFHTSASVPPDLLHSESGCHNTTASFSEQKKNDIISSTRDFRRDLDIIKQRATRVCQLAKTLIDDFSIAVEFKCQNYTDLWQQLRQNLYTQVKILLNKSEADDFDNFHVFVPPWLSTDKDQVEKLLSIICTQQIPLDEINKNASSPSYMVFLPKKTSHRQNIQWTGEILFIQASESTKLALNSKELCSLHLVVNRSDHWEKAATLFHSHVGLSNIQLIRRLPRDEDIRFTFDQLPEHIEKLSIELTALVRILNTIWDQDSTKIYLTEIVKFDERTIESKLVDLVLYVYNSGFDLFRLLYDLIPSISPNDDAIFEKFVKTMNDFFCEWCRCVTKKFKYISMQQARTAKYKVFRPKWLSPGMIFLRFLAKSTHLQLLSDEDYKRLTKEMPAALDALYGNMKVNYNSPTTKDISFLNDRLHHNLGIVRSSSVSSTLTSVGRQRHISGASGHRRGESGGRYNEIIPSAKLTPRERIAQKIKDLDHDLEKKFRERKQIGRIFNATTLTSGTTTDPTVSLRTRNIDFPWRRGTRIGQGGAGVAFRAINCSNGSIVCMKEIQLSSIASRSLPNAYPEKLRRIAEEIDMIMSINHPNIVRYFGIEKYKRTIYICMEYCLSTVNEFLNDVRSFEKRAHIKRKNSVLWSDSSEQDENSSTNDVRLNSSLDVNEYVREFVKQLLNALMVLHENNIVHCDVKGDNIFIANEDGKYIVKLGDFNLSHRLELESSSSGADGSHSTQKGTIHFKPPEPEFVCKSDIWALGCTIIEMLTGRLPWTNVTRAHENQIYIQNQLLAKKGPPIPDELQKQKEAYGFIQLCLKADLEQRPTARELLNDPYSRVK